MCLRDGGGMGRASLCLEKEPSGDIELHFLYERCCTKKGLGTFLHRFNHLKSHTCRESLRRTPAGLVPWSGRKSKRSTKQFLSDKHPGSGDLKAKIRGDLSPSSASVVDRVTVSSVLKTKLSKFRGSGELTSDLDAAASHFSLSQGWVLL